jgi:hypothetical protein
MTAGRHELQRRLHLTSKTTLAGWAAYAAWLAEEAGDAPAARLKAEP